MSDESEDNFSEEFLEDSENTENQNDNTNLEDTESQHGDANRDLYNVKIKFIVKEFLSQRNGKVVKTEIIRCDTLEMFFQKIWDVAALHVKKEICFNDETNSYMWSADVPSAEKMEKFIRFQAANNKRPYETDRITLQMLHSWVTSDHVSCYIYVYGALIGSKAVFADVQKTLIQPDETDRSGAAANAVLFDIMSELKNAHPNLSATDVSWLRWANYIIAMDAGNRNQQINELPPPSLVQLFGQTRSNADQELQIARRSIRIGQRVNGSVLDTVKVLLEDVNELTNDAECHFLKAKRLKRSLEALSGQLESNNNLLDGFGEAVGPEEDGFGADLYQQIEDLEDQDHF